MTRKNLNHASAFSLVELSIVLVILGLLTGGILAGQNLIRAAELRSVTTDFAAYQTAVMTFKDKYFALPGDMTNATDFWGAMSSGTCPNATGGTGTQTCNGDGDGKIEGSGAVSQSNERFTFWQHLANAGLIEGSYDGLAGSGGTAHSIPGTNVPTSKISNGGWFANYWGAITGAASLFDGEYGNVLLIGGTYASAEPAIALFSPEEMWNIDTKMDDGMPARGRVVPRHRANCTNATSAVADSDNLDSVYNLANTSLYCVITFKKVF